MKRCHVKKKKTKGQYVVGVYVVVLSGNDKGSTFMNTDTNTLDCVDRVINDNPIPDIFHPLSSRTQNTLFFRID